MSPRFGLTELVLLNLDLFVWGWIAAQSLH